jgi:hypothetical protein
MNSFFLTVLKTLSTSSLRAPIEQLKELGVSMDRIGSGLDQIILFFLSDPNLIRLNLG